MPDSTERGSAWIARYTTASLSSTNTIAHAEWVHQYGSWLSFDGPTDRPNDIVVDATGNVYIAGERQPQWSGYARSYGPTGTLRWDTQLGGVTADDFATDVALDNWGNVFATGRSTGVVPGAPEANLGGVDGFVAQLRQSDGSLGWRHMFGTSTDDGGRAVVATGQRVTVAGFADGNPANGLQADISSIVQAYENDLIAPTLTFSVPAAGGGATYELGSSVAAAYVCTDPGESAAPPTGSGIDPVGGCPDATPLDTGLQVGEHAAPGNAPPIARTYGPVTTTDVAGNSATFSEDYGIVDTTNPAASVSAPADGTEFIRAVAGTTTIATFSCSDLDLKTCTGSVNGGTPSTSPMAIPIDALGSFTLTVTGSDWAGNAATSVVNFTVVTPPVVLPGGASVAEGNAGNRVVLVPVRLSRPSALAVTVQWRTSDAAAQPAVGVDYLAASGTVTFAAGETAKTVSITVRGDTLDEPNEWIAISFRNATNATIGGTYGLGFAVILDDDPPPVVLPGGASVAEGNAGNRVVLVPVRLSRPSGLAVTVQWRTSDVAAQPAVGVDYVAASGTVTFAPGETAKTVSITVRGDTLDEPNEWISISFRNATNAAIGGKYGLGAAVIVDDD
jgi:hypothetical protein